MAKQLVVLRLLLLLCVAITLSPRPVSAMHTPPSVHTDLHMGIRVYSFPLVVPELEPTAYELRVYLRTICTKGPDVLIKGFAGAFPVTGSEPKGLSLFNPHFQPPALQQRKLHITSKAAPVRCGSSNSSSAGAKACSSGSGRSSSTVLSWRGPANQGFWRLDGKVKPRGVEVLSLEGSEHVHQLLLSCNGRTAPANTSPFPAVGLWNVVTTTSANSLPPKTLAHLLLLHMQYHERLGVAGTVLRCNKGEAQDLAVLPHIETLVAQGKLLLWPWVHEHSTGHTPFYWQKPRNQLTLLAAYGNKNLKLAFFDLDEYLVLPQGGSLADARCAGKPLLGDRNQPAWSFLRYSARSCSNAQVDLACWMDGRAMPVSSGVELLFEKCPCRFHKPILQPELVTTLSVHYVWPSNGRKVTDVPHSCAYLVHLHALVQHRQHFMPTGLAASHMRPAVWELQGAGSAQVMLPHGGNMTAWLHDVRTCEALRKVAGKQTAKRFSMC